MSEHNPTKRIVGVDGEGSGDGYNHRYRYLAAVYENTEVAAEAENLEGLTSRECFDAILRIPSNALIMGYSLGYDITFWLKDLPKELAWKLLRPEERQTPKGILKPIVWWPISSVKGYRLNFVQGRLDIARVRYKEHVKTCGGDHWPDSEAHRLQVNCPGIMKVKYYKGMPYSIGCRQEPCLGCKVEAKVRVWDVWKFFQGRFLNACQDWKVVTKEKYAQLEEFKDLRGKEEFAQRWAEVKEYCKLECSKMAALGRLIIEAHKDADIPLRDFYGAGSSGSAMLLKMNARDYMMTKKVEGKKIVYEKMEQPEELKDAVATAFFGGRFEISQRGPICLDIHSGDIASAYPYQFSQLPCLVHGQWRKVKGKGALAAIENSNAAVVRYELPLTSNIKIERRLESVYQWESVEHKISSEPWGPFPLRHTDGCITFPVTSGGGWVWKSEFLAGLRFAKNVKLIEAWVYNTDCDCEVFRKKMPEYYKLRLQWGKEGRGIVVKLGCNSCPGKTAQSKGPHPKFQNFIWAGMVNAGTRAQLLDAMGSDRESVLSTATDGLLSTRPLTYTEPIDLGTSQWLACATPAEKDLKNNPNAFRKSEESPTGWQTFKPLGSWEVRPEPIHGLFIVRPGVLFPMGKDSIKETKARGVGKKVLSKHEKMVIAAWEKDGPKTINLARDMFWGARSCLRMSSDKAVVTKDKKYGSWEKQPVTVSYEPTPKRPYADSKHRLYTWAFGQSVVSEKYDPAIVPAHVKILREEADIMMDQPDVIKDDGEDLEEI